MYCIHTHQLSIVCFVFLKHNTATCVCVLCGALLACDHHQSERPQNGHPPYIKPTQYHHHHAHLIPSPSYPPNTIIMTSTARQAHKMLSLSHCHRETGFMYLIVNCFVSIVRLWVANWKLVQVGGTVCDFQPILETWRVDKGGQLRKRIRNEKQNDSGTVGWDIQIQIQIQKQKNSGTAE